MQTLTFVHFSISAAATMCLAGWVVGFGNDLLGFFLLRFATDYVGDSNFSLILRGMSLHIFGSGYFDNNLPKTNRNYDVAGC